MTTWTRRSFLHATALALAGCTEKPISIPAQSRVDFCPDASLDDPKDAALREEPEDAASREDASVPDTSSEDADTSDAQEPPAGERPLNFVVILADDLGWMDTTVYGSRYYETPNLERLAARSMVFKRAYAAPLCSPTRASILTGKNPGRLGFTEASGHLAPVSPNAPRFPTSAPPYEPILTPRSERNLALSEVTTAEALEGAGYKTAFIGKWHLGIRPEHWPDQQGFSVNAAGEGNAAPSSYFAPYGFSTLPEGEPGEYLTDRLTAEALSFLDCARDVPFFLSLWHYGVHTPLQAPEADIDRFRDKEDPRGLQSNATMAGMVAAIDRSVGRILDRIDELGIRDSTVIIFASDNGGNEYVRPAPTDNAPLRGGKAQVYEGGLRVPLMVAWPGGGWTGTVSEALVSPMDIHPTILEWAGLPWEDLGPSDGRSLVPLLLGASSEIRDGLVCHFPHRQEPASGLLNLPCSALVLGRHKLIRRYMTSPEMPERIELYDLSSDLGETRNLASSQPELAAALERRMDQELLALGAQVPIPNPAYLPAARANVLGWTASRDAILLPDQDGLLVRATGVDPYLIQADVPRESGDMWLEVVVDMVADDTMEVFWTDDQSSAFRAEARSTVTTLAGQGTYRLPIPAVGAIRTLRLDPSRRRGELRIRRIDLANGSNIVRTWAFA